MALTEGVSLLRFIPTKKALSDELLLNMCLEKQEKQSRDLKMTLFYWWGEIIRTQELAVTRPVIELVPS